MQKTWKKYSLLEKTATILYLALSLAVVVLAALQLLDVWTSAIRVCTPLLGVMVLLQAYLQRQHKTTVIVSLCAAGVILVCSIFILAVG